jgi:uncharacterized membrane protein (DUF373 family)
MSVQCSAKIVRVNVVNIYYAFEVALVGVFLIGAGVSMYWLISYTIGLLDVDDPDTFRSELIHLVELSIYTLIFLDLARTIATSITTRRFSLEGVMEAGMLAMIREFVGLTAAEKPLPHILAVIAVFVALFTAWLTVKTRVRD